MWKMDPEDVFSYCTWWYSDIPASDLLVYQRVLLEALFLSSPATAECYWGLGQSEARDSLGRWGTVPLDTVTTLAVGNIARAYLKHPSKISGPYNEYFPCMFTTEEGRVIRYIHHFGRARHFSPPWHLNHFFLTATRQQKFRRYAV